QTANADQSPQNRVKGSLHRSDPVPSNQRTLQWLNPAAGVKTVAASVDGTEYDRSVGSAEAEAVRQRTVDPALLRRFRDAIDHALPAGCIEVQCRRRHV